MDQARWDMFFRLGMDHYANGDWDQARQAFEVTVDEAQSEGGLNLARSLNNLACALSKQGQLAQSISVQDQALGLLVELYGPEAELVCSGLLNIAADYGRAGRPAEAETVYSETIERIRRGGHRELEAQALENWSQFYLAQDKLGRAAEVLQSLRDLLADKPEQQARVLHTLTHLYDALGDIEKADKARENTLSLIETLWGPDNLAYAEVVANLAESLVAQGRFGPAAPLYGKAARAFSACVPPDDARLVGCQLGQVIALREAGQLTEAVEAALAAEQRWTLLTRPPGDYRRWLNEHGLAVFLLKRYEEAAVLFERSLGQPGELPVPTRISIAFNLASAFSGAGRNADARTLLEQLATLAEEHLGGEHQLTWRIWLQLSELGRAQGDQELVRVNREKLERHAGSGTL